MNKKHFIGTQTLFYLSVSEQKHFIEIQTLFYLSVSEQKHFIETQTKANFKVGIFFMYIKKFLDGVSL